MTDTLVSSPHDQRDDILFQLDTTIRDVLKSGGISQRELAERANISTRTVRRVLSSYESCTITTLARIFAALEIRIEIRVRHKGPTQ